MTPTATQGTDRKVISRNFQSVSAGESQIVVAGRPGVAYRVVAVQAAAASNGKAILYSGDAYNKDKCFFDAQVLAGTTAHLVLGDWAFCGGVGENIDLDSTGGAFDITVFYVEIQNTTGTV